MTEEQLLEDLEAPEPENIDFEVGDSVVYPHHGAGKVLKKEPREMFGEEREYLTIKILHNDMTVMVPCCNAGKAGLRRIIDEEAVKKVMAVLNDDMSEMPKNWNRRFKHNRDKIKTGDIFELAEVVRNLAIREFDKGLSTGEKQMFTRAKKILASELMYALDKDEEEAEAYLNNPARRVGGRFARGRLVALALLLAAGRGERLGANTPKAFLPVGGRPMLDGRSTRCAPRPRSRRSSSRSRREPPRRRARSACRAGVSARSRCATPSPPLLATPCSSATPRGRCSPPQLAEAVLAGLKGADASIAAAPVVDTIKETADGRVVSRTLDRSVLWAVQTPQAFRREALERALAQPDDIVAAATDDASLVEAMGGVVHLVEAPRENLKVTTPLDLRLADLLIRERLGDRP